jgi:glutamine synthetase
MLFHQAIIEYVWLDGFGELRSKIRVMDIPEEDGIISYNIFYNNKMFIWNYDGSSCNQATTEDSEVILKPVKVYCNPLLKKNVDPKDYNPFSFLFLCESVDKNGNPVNGCNYQYAKDVFDNNKVKNSDIWFGIEQEYFFVEPTTKYPVDFIPYDHDHNNQYIQGPYYCGVGGNHMYYIQRKIALQHMQICLEMNIPISGINAEVAPNQWEYQVGPCVGIKACHDLWISRYILKRIAEMEKYDVTFHPKPLRSPEFEERWNGSGAHINVSTKDTRAENGLDTIYQYMDLLKEKHQEHLEVYGKDNEYRLTGNHETGNINVFTFGVGTRNTSVRIPNQTAFDKKGYFEDRRPASNVDPYLACAIIAKTIC